MHTYICIHIQVYCDPYLGFGVDSRARLQQCKRGVLVSARGGSVKRSPFVLLQRRGQR